ncbi:MAG: glutamyl-tRNA reductase [Flavobacteriales bacterium]|nr:glutamyl-tRNA reductase [Flavobacteriales bacterium]MDG1439566.1 glutamyl-tRNA reductase [Flavobacteriales bacterium]MDG1797052.1 glutamyl-tRNA reductase [Flavobacteriales bacterium]
MNKLQIIALTHRNFNFDEIGKFHLDDSVRMDRLEKLKSKLKINELMYLSTCNRVEFIINSDAEVNQTFLESLLSEFISQESLIPTMRKIEIFSEKEAVHHLFSLASSIDSLVVGEREIITQVRKAFEECRESNLCGDFIRVLIQKTIFTAKKVYTESEIATRPVSIVSLAYLELKKYISKQPKTFLIIGAGKTISSMLKFINKNDQHEFLIFNRSTEKAEQLVSQLNLKAKVFPLAELGTTNHEFDCIVSCTGSQDVILTKEKFLKINPERNKKLIVDLAVPNDCDQKISKELNTKIINVDQLKIRAEENLKARSKEINSCLAIIEKQIIQYYLAEKERTLERALSAVPESIKGIRKKAFKEVFVKELETLDPQAINIVNSLVDYMEKKYISVPMKMAKDIFLKETSK